MAKSTLKRISANLPTDLVEEATRITEANITDTLILGLQLVKRSLAYKKAMNLKGKIQIDVDLRKAVSAKLVIDTSIWVAFFRGKTVSEFESALAENRVLVTPIVLSELISGTKKTSEQDSVIALFQDLEFCDCSLEHWIRVGKLRNKLLKHGLSVSTPDAHLFQCALDYDAKVLSEDKIFSQIKKIFK